MKMPEEVKLEIRPSFASAEGFRTNRFTDLEILEERPRAIKVSAKGLVPDNLNCWYCSQPLRTPESQMLGVGPTCAERIGIPKKIRSAPEEAERWYGSVGNLKEQWLPRSIILYPHHLRLNTVPDGDSAVTYNEWTDSGSCLGNLTLGYRPTPEHSRYEGLLCLEIFCEMGMGFHNSILSTYGAKWHGGERRSPSWRNARDIGKDKVWTVPFSTENVGRLMALASRWKVQLTIEEDLIQIVRSLREGEQGREEIIQGLGLTDIQEIKQLTPSSLDKVDWGQFTKTNPYDHQRAALLFIAARMGLDIPFPDKESPKES